MKNISLSPIKTYIGYPSVAVLGQKVDGLGQEIRTDKYNKLLPRRVKLSDSTAGLIAGIRFTVRDIAKL